MFVNKPKVTVPKGSTESFVVKYQKGRKPFPTFDEAIRFANEQKQMDKGWAEVIHVVETVVRAR